MPGRRRAERHRSVHPLRRRRFDHSPLLQARQQKRTRGQRNATITEAVLPMYFPKSRCTVAPIIHLAINAFLRLHASEQIIF